MEKLIRNKAGGVCPFAVNEDVSIYLDVSMKRFAQVHTAEGIDTATIRADIEELEQYSYAVDCIDICKGWYMNEN